MNLAVATSLRDLVRERGGYVNAHSHLDTAFMLGTEECTGAAQPLEWCRLGQLPLTEKLELLDRQLRDGPGLLSTLPRRMSRALDVLIDDAVRACRTCVMVTSRAQADPIAMAAAVRERYASRILVQIVASHLSDVHLDRAERRHFEAVCESPDVDVVGGLSYVRGEGTAEHYGWLVDLAARVGKPVELHADALLARDEHDTETILRALARAREQGYDGGVSLVHCVSLSGQSIARRRRAIALLRDLDAHVVICPRAALSMRRLEVRSYMHNCIAPFVELVDGGVGVGIGTDNVCDVFLPLSAGSMGDEIEFLAEATRCYDLALLADIACQGGAAVLGLNA